VFICRNAEGVHGQRKLGNPLTGLMLCVCLAWLSPSKAINLNTDTQIRCSCRQSDKGNQSRYFRGWLRESN